MNNHHILAANCQRPITEEERKRYICLKEHYEGRATYEWPDSYLLWIKGHLRFINKVLDSGMIGSYKD